MDFIVKTGHGDVNIVLCLQPMVVNHNDRNTFIFKLSDFQIFKSKPVCTSAQLAYF